MKNFFDALFGESYPVMASDFTLHMWLLVATVAALVFTVRGWIGEFRAAEETQKDLTAAFETRARWLHDCLGVMKRHPDLIATTIPFPSGHIHLGIVARSGVPVSHERLAQIYTEIDNSVRGSDLVFDAAFGYQTVGVPEEKGDDQEKQ